MALTKKDISQIDGIVVTHMETLAQIVARGFESVDKRFELVDKHLELIDRRIEQINAELQHVNARLDTIEHDIADIRRHLVYRDEFEEVLARLSAIEKRLSMRKTSVKSSP